MKLLTQQKEARLEREHDALVNFRLQRLPKVLREGVLEGADVHGFLVEIALLQDVRAIINAQTKELLRPEQFLALNLPANVQQFKDARKESFLRRVATCSADQAPPDGVDPFALARMTIACNFCAKMLRYPHLLSHNCLQWDGRAVRGK